MKINLTFIISISLSFFQLTFLANNAFAYCQVVPVMDKENKQKEIGCLAIADEFEKFKSKQRILYSNSRYLTLFKGELLLDCQLHCQNHNSSQQKISSLRKFKHSCELEEHPMQFSGLPLRNDLQDNFRQIIDSLMEKRRPLAEDLSSQQRERSEFLQNEIMAVHATQFFPKDGMIKLARNSTRGGFRPKIHFALGGLVESHSGGIWENSPLAIIVPLKSLTPQLVNLNINDTNIMGDFTIPPGAAIVVDKNQYAEENFSGVEFKDKEIYFFDAKITSLRDKISEILEMKGKLQIKNSSLNSVSLRGKRRNDLINYPEFFKPFLLEHPHISFEESEGSSSYGKNGFFGQIDWNVMALDGSMNVFPFYKTLPELQYHIFLIEDQLRRLEGILQEQRISKIQWKGFEIAKKDVERKLILAKKEMELRHQKRTLYRSSKNLVKQAYELSKHPQKLDKFLKENLEFFEPYSLEMEREIDPTMLGGKMDQLVINRDLAGLSAFYSEFPQYFQKFSDNFGPSLESETKKENEYFEFTLQSNKQPIKYMTSSSYDESIRSAIAYHDLKVGDKVAIRQYSYSSFENQFFENGIAVQEYFNLNEEYEIIGIKKLAREKISTFE